MTNLKKIRTSTIILLSIFTVSSIVFPIQYLSADTNVPGWFRGVAGFWAEGKISTEEFVSSIEFLLKEGIVRTPSVQVEKSSDPRQALGEYDKEQKIKELEKKLKENDNIIQELEKKVKDRDMTTGSDVEYRSSINTKSQTNNMMSKLREQMIKLGADSSALKFLDDLQNVIAQQAENHNSSRSNVALKIAELENEIEALKQIDSVAIKEEGVK